MKTRSDKERNRDVTQKYMIEVVIKFVLVNIERNNHVEVKMTDSTSESVVINKRSLGSGNVTCLCIITIL